MAEYGVGGVPHFVFMDGNNEPLAAAVGRLPRKVLEGACGCGGLCAALMVQVTPSGPGGTLNLCMLEHLECLL